MCVIIGVTLMLKRKKFYNRIEPCIYFPSILKKYQNLEKICFNAVALIYIHIKFQLFK